MSLRGIPKLEMSSLARTALFGHIFRRDRYHGDSKGHAAQTPYRASIRKHILDFTMLELKQAGY